MGDYQNGFRYGRSVIDNIFALKIINEKLRECNQSVQYIFIDFQKAMTLYIEIHYGNVWKNSEFLLNYKICVKHVYKRQEVRFE